MKPLSLLLFTLSVLAFEIHTVAAPTPDWLIDPGPFQARVTRSQDGRELELNNGLLRRVIRIEPNAATRGQVFQRSARGGGAHVGGG